MATTGKQNIIIRLTNFNIIQATQTAEVTANILKRRKGKLKLKLKKGKATNMDQVTEATAEVIILSVDTVKQAINIKKKL